MEESVLLEQYERLQNELAEVQQNDTALKIKLTKLNKRIKFYKRNISLLEKRKKRLKIQDGGLGKIFSDTQIDVLLGHKKVIWTDDDLAMAFTLRHMGTRECYLYLKNSLNIPLPSLSSVQKWAALRLE